MNDNIFGYHSKHEFLAAKINLKVFKDIVSLLNLVAILAQVHLVFWLENFGEAGARDCKGFQYYGSDK